jgi:hypothetical protein
MWGISVDLEVLYDKSVYEGDDLKVFSEAMEKFSDGIRQGE